MALRLTADDKLRILRRYEEGIPLRQIARGIGRPDITVRRTLEAAGVVFGPPRTSNKRTDPDTESRVCGLYDEGQTWREIMEQTGVTDVTVSKILKRNGREFDRKPEPAASKAEEAAFLYEAGHSTRAIARMLGHSKSTINRLVVDAGGDLRHLEGCGHPDYLDNVDTPEKAYWLGFISADGCIVTTARYPGGDHLALQLAARDIDHVIAFKEAVGATAGVFTRTVNGFGTPTQTATLSVGSRQLTLALIALGVGPRKSETLEPWNGPADLMPHYWRGMVDGDGSLAIKGGGQYTVFFCGSEPCVRAFTGWAAGVSGTTAQPYYQGGCWYISISGRRQVRILVNALYTDAPISLQRKQERADQILAASTTERARA